MFKCRTRKALASSSCIANVCNNWFFCCGAEQRSAKFHNAQVEFMMSLTQKSRLKPAKASLLWSKAKRKDETESETVNQEPISSAGALQHDGKGLEPWPSPSHPQALAEEDADLALVIPLDEEQHEAQRGARKKGGAKRKLDVDVAEGSDTAKCASVEEDPVEVEIDADLDRVLETKSRQHNLTTMNVRNIIHEVITNEHVVAMMKAAITDTEPLPIFEPKMTRSKLKEVVEKGVVIPAWNMSPIKKPTKIKAPQFVDIPLEEEDSSDEEYCPNEDEEDETAEETFLESDMESTASSPRGSRAGPPRIPMEYEEDSPTQRACKSRHLQVEVVPMGPPPPPQPVGSPRCPRTPPECSFMEKLHAVEEELATSPICMDPYQSLSGGGHENNLMACRTRSKRPLRDVPLGQLEAELRAPDITPDMYECVSAPEDREWAQWLQGLMASDVENEEDGDDDDDPEYNFLEDIDEPDLEDYRNDRAVRISKKEVNELMEELFQTFHDELGVQEQDEEGQEEDEEKQEKIPAEPPNVSVPQTNRFDEPLPHTLTQHRRTVREQLAAIRQYQARLGSKARVPPARCLSPPCVLSLTLLQKQQLQQQIQQHIQLLTQMHMLSRTVEALQNEANLTQQFLAELQVFAQRGEETRGTMEPGFISVFRACNLHGAVSLLDELRAPSSPHSAVLPEPVRPKSGRLYPLLPAGLAWLLATRPVFLYPELLPHCSLDPALHPSHTSTIYTQGENSLLVLGLRNFSEAVYPYQLISQYLVCTKSPKQLRRHFYCQNNLVPSMPLACRRVMPEEQCPPVEREEDILPSWLRKSLPFIHEEVQKYNSLSDLVSPIARRSTLSYTFPHGTQYPPSLPQNLTMHATGFRRLRPLSTSMLCSEAVSNPPSFCAPSSENVEEQSQVANAHHSTSTGIGEQGMQEQTQQIPTRKLCRIQPAPPKPPLVGQLFTVVPGGIMNIVSLGGQAAGGSISVHIGEIKTGVEPVGQCSLAPPIIMNLVPASSPSVVCPTPTDSSINSSPVQMAWKSVAHPTNVVTQPHRLSRPLIPVTSVGPSQHAPGPDLVSATMCELISPTPLALKPTITVNNGAHNPDASAPKRKSGESHSLPNKFHFSKTPSMPKHSEIREITLADVRAVSQAPDSSELPSTNPSVHFGNEVYEEEQEEQEKDICQEEEEEYCDYGGALLTLSESSASQASSLDSCADAFEILLDAEEETDRQNKAQQAKYRQVKRVDMGSNKVPSLSKWRTKCTGMTLEMNTVGKAQRQLETRDEADEGCEKRKREYYTQTKGDKQQQLNDRQETFSELISKHDEEEMSSSSEKSVLSVPELQETMEKLSWLASDRRLYEEGDVRKDDDCISFSSTSTSCEFSTPVSQNSQVEEKGICEDEKAVSVEGEMPQLPGKSRDHMLNSDPLGEKEDTDSAQSYLNSKSHYVVFHTSSKSPSDTHEGKREEDQEEAVTESRDLRGDEKGTKQWERNDPSRNNLLQSEELEGRQSKEQTKLGCPSKRKSQKNEETGGSVPNPQSARPNTIICAKNISLTPSGERVILWTRETDRAILTACQAQGATKNTFQAISAQLGNKSASEVAKRFQDLVRLFHAAAQRTHPESHTTGSSAADKPD
ncbi:GON-4-like protein isoform X2 [Arapaima gigas]